MWYKKEKIEVLNPLEAYDKAAKHYKRFHKDLDEWDSGVFQRFLPRDVSWMHLVDLGSWDGRMHKFFSTKKLASYVACDISAQMLKYAPSSVDKRVMDLDLDWNLPTDHFDIALCFFSLLHLKSPEHFMAELSKILKIWWKCILLHHIERRNFEYRINNTEVFRVNIFRHPYEDIEKAALNWFFDIDTLQLTQNGAHIATLYCLTKK